MKKTKEENEVSQVEDLCRRMGISEDILYIKGLGTDDPPDVEFEIAGHVIGVECTAYQGTVSGKEINDKFNHQALRNEFFECLHSRDIAAITGFHIERISFLGFIGESVKLPPRKLFEPILDEIVSLVGEHAKIHKTKCRYLFHRAEIERSGRPLIVEYINNISYSINAPIFIGHSEVISHVDFNDDALVTLIERKTKAIAKKLMRDPDKINRYKEFWLLIHNGEFEPLFSSVNRLRGYSPSSTTRKIIEHSPFEKIFVTSLGCIFEIQNENTSVELKPA